MNDIEENVVSYTFMNLQIKQWVLFDFYFEG